MALIASGFSGLARERHLELSQAETPRADGWGDTRDAHVCTRHGHTVLEDGEASARVSALRLGRL